MPIVSLKNISHRFIRDQAHIDNFGKLGKRKSINHTTEDKPDILQQFATAEPLYRR